MNRKCALASPPTSAPKAAADRSNRAGFMGLPFLGKWGGQSSSADDLPAALDVVPHHVAVQFAAGGEEDAPPGGLRHAVGELHIFVGLVPAVQEENVDRDPLAGAK